jgi:periplasmic protein TonB
MPMLDQKTGSQTGNTLPDAVLEQQQRRRMLIALAVLLLALISVLIKDRQFWFPTSPSAESETPEQTAPVRTAQTTAKVTPPIVAPKPVRPAPTRSQSKSTSSSKPAAAPPDDGAMSPVITATNRAVLPPLEVEVVAGNQHRTLSPGDSSVNVEMQSSTPSGAEQTTAPTGDSSSGGASAAAQVQLSPGTVQVVSRPVDPSYPLLAKQMKVQGAVVLEALISKTGSIQEIQIISGPAILSAAAREAVKQWHFKPYYQSGRPVETEARITVNFTISTY